MPETPEHGPHAILSAGGTGHGLHFFEDAAAQIFTDPEALRAVRFVPGALQHIALMLPDEEAGQALQAWLQGLLIQPTKIIDLRLNRSFRLMDNMGLIIEVAWLKPEPSPLT